jgi:uncharacterized protein
VSGVLLDVDVLIALLWPAHEAHKQTQRWFARNAARGWATCPITQSGFVRIVSNPAFSRHAVSPKAALDVLKASLRHPHHRFWADDLDVAQSIGPLLPRLQGHQQVTDAYLLGLVLHKKGSLATLDRSVVALAASPEALARIEVL